MNNITQFRERAAGNRGEFVTLCTGYNSEGTPYYAYLKVPADQLNHLKAAQDQGTLHLQDFGEIIYFGYQDKPPEDIQKMVMNIYLF